MSFTGFGNLNLSGVETEEFHARTLPVGEHVCKIAKAEMQQTKNGTGWRLMVRLEAVDGSGYVKDDMNIANASPKAQEIGRKRLKHLLVEAGHPNPDHPGDIKTLQGLVVGVIVEKGESWTSRDGQLMEGVGEPRRFAPYFKIEKYNQPHQPQQSAGGAAGFDDKIPF